MLTLYQAEWCPFSSAVREVLTELGLDFVAKQVEAWPEDRASMRDALGVDQIPALVVDDGAVHVGTRRIFAYLETFESPPGATEHRARFEEHLTARERDVAAKLLVRFRRDHAGPPVEAKPEDADVVNVPAEHRYELRVGERVIGCLAYRLEDSTVAFTHTVVDKACEGRGFGTRLVRDAVADAEAAGLRIVPLCSFVRGYLERRTQT
ncbi:MAG TPA: GNAT family N-acetyltransferase [Gaiellaceae bacterium]